MNVFRPHPKLEGTSFRLQYVWLVIIAVVFESIFREGGTLHAISTKILAFATLFMFAVLYWLTVRAFPCFTAMRFSDHIRGLRNAGSEMEHLAATQRFHVAVVDWPGEPRALQVAIPDCTVYYPTLVAPAATPRSLLPVHSPYGDSRVGQGIMKYQGTPRFGAWHLTDARILATVGAAPACDGVAVGTATHPVIVFSHGLGAHRHLYSSLAMDLAALGAIVVCVQHCDGSSCFALARSTDRAATTIDDFKPVPFLPVPKKKAVPGREIRQTPEQQLRQRQLIECRIPELSAVISRIHSGELLPALGFHTCKSINPIRPAVMGHSFGGATVVGAAIKDALLQRISSVVALDFWSVPSSWMRDKIVSMPMRQLLSPLLFLDSQEWHMWAANREMENDIGMLWGKRCARRWTQSTDHLSMTDAAFLFNIIFARKWYCSADDRLQTALWAAQAFHHVSSFCTQ